MPSEWASLRGSPKPVSERVWREAANAGAEGSSSGCEAALSFVMDGAPFAFSALPNTALELEAADHREDLPAAPHTQLCLYAAMRGVGGIDSWYSDVEAPYHVSGEEDHAVSVKVRL